MQDVNSVSLWMDTFPHCLFPVKATFPGLPTLNMPNVCTEQLKPKSAFCVYHTEIAIDRGYPTQQFEVLWGTGLPRCLNIVQSVCLYIYICLPALNLRSRV